MTQLFKVIRLESLFLYAFGSICTFFFLNIEKGYAAKAHVYEVADLKGTVWTRGPNQTRWQRSWEGQHLVDGQLIQVTNDSAVTLREVVSSSEDSLLGERMQLRITQPLIARITPEMLLSVKVSSYFVEDQGSQIPQGFKITDLKLNFSDAWQRLTAVVTGRAPQVSKVTLTELAKEGMALGSSAKKLTILVPSMHAVVETGDWPADLKVVWRHPETKHFKYLVYLWPAGSPRGVPVATTENDFFTVQLRQAGVYLVQITSVDGSWQSRGHVIHANLPPRALAAKGSAVSQNDRIEILRPKYPLDHTSVVMAGADKVSVDFVWDGDTLRSSDSVELKIVGTDGQVVHEERTKSTQLAVMLTPGHYKWFLNTGPSGSISERRTLIVIQQNFTTGNLVKSDLFKKALREKSGTVLVLTDGL